MGSNQRLPQYSCLSAVLQEISLCSFPLAIYETYVTHFIIFFSFLAILRLVPNHLMARPHRLLIPEMKQSLLAPPATFSIPQFYVIVFW